MSLEYFLQAGVFCRWYFQDDEFHAIDFKVFFPGNMKIKSVINVIILQREKLLYKAIDEIVSFYLPK